MPSAYLGEYDPTPKIEAAFEKVKDELLKAIKAAGGKLYTRINVKGSYKMPLRRGGHRLVPGRIPDGNGGYKTKLQTITADDVEKDTFSPGFGLAIVQFLRIEHHNATHGPDEQMAHRTVYDNTGNLRIKPFEVGTKDYFANQVINDQLDAAPLFSGVTTPIPPTPKGHPLLEGDKLKGMKEAPK